MKVIAVASTKGGVGKSTISLAFCDQLSVGLGRKVLGVDLDPQCSLSKFHFTIQKDQLDAGPDWWSIAQEAAVNPTAWGALKAQIRRNVSTVRTDSKSRGQLDILPAIARFRPVDANYDPRRFDGVDLPTLTAILRKEWETEGYDFVVADTPGNESVYQRAILQLADAVIIPTIPDRTSDQEMAGFVDTIAKELGPEFWRRRVGRIVISKIQLGRADHIEEALSIRHRWDAARSPYGKCLTVATRQLPQRDAFGRNLHSRPHKSLKEKYRETGYPFIKNLVDEVLSALSK